MKKLEAIPLLSDNSELQALRGELFLLSRA